MFLILKNYKNLEENYSLKKHILLVQEESEKR